MLDLRKKLGELTGFVKGSVAEGLNNLRAGIQETATTAVTAVGNAVIDNVATPILDAKDAYDKKVRQDVALAKPPVITMGNKTMTRNAEGLPPVMTPLEQPVPPVKNAASVIQSQIENPVPIAQAEEPIVKKAVPPEKDNELFRKGITYNETRGVVAAGKEPYKAIGPTKDIGKYQVSPSNLSAWSKSWLGKKYTPEEFKNDPAAQEKFFTEFLRVKDKYDVTNEEAAIMWHRGYGVLGFKGSFEEKKQQLKKYLDEVRHEDKSVAYVNSFREGTSTTE